MLNSNAVLVFILCCLLFGVFSLDTFFSPDIILAKEENSLDTLTSSKIQADSQFYNYRNYINQFNYPKNYFRSPLNIPIFLSGTFAEIRNNHFHAGIDIKTDGRQGKEVFSVADGYVQRIKVSAVGYGKSLYIVHPNGYMSVFAHLQKFNPQIDKFVKEVQYQKQSFEIDIFPGQSILPVKKGQVIAYSGNSGGSQAPHLHFEIRDAKTEYIINPLLFSYELDDHIPPVIAALAIYPLEKSSTVNNSDKNKYVSVRKTFAGNYFLQSSLAFTVHGKIGFGINAHDFANDRENKNGIYSIELKKNDTTIYYQELEKFGFHQTRMVNCHIDFEKKQKTGFKYQKSFLSDGNKLNFYKYMLNKGEIYFYDDSLHNLEYIVKDIYGNESRLKFEVQSSSKSTEEKHTTSGTNGFESSDYSAVFFPEQNNNFKNDEIVLNIPPHTFYDTLHFQYSSESGNNNSRYYSSIHKIHNSLTPVHSYYNISIKPINLPDSLRDKALIVSFERSNGETSEGGYWADGFITTRTRSLGKFAVMVDTVSPVVSPLNIYNNKNMSNSSKIMFRISDNLSGIRSYDAYIDGKWVLMEYDAKSNLITHFFDERTVSGTHQFYLVVTDKKNNKTEFTADFITQ